ncbi:ABC transporter ATP-binding protein [Tsukamurella strandjordii]|uniref:ABC transporter ATP-binding protein n=1 Tax=Tsukamurella strandjordii TaxID=147577 RepID=A0AA90SLI2_9ACTN|nr:ABC transporter ATP-binding protein [Tsukamurella strandjordii]MDP0398332.1 ABC transporter ATP-binding protein [Tsukamurella strandjordii]
MTTTGESTAPGLLPVADGRTTFSFARGLLRGRGGALAGVIVILLLGAALGLVAPWGFGAMVDNAINRGEVADVVRIGAVMAVATIAGAALTGVGIAASAQLFETALARLRERMLGAALRLPQERVEAAGSGDLVSRATDDVVVVSEAISRGVPALSRSGFTVAVTMFGLAAVDWRFLVVVVAVLPVYWAGVRMYLRTAPPVYRAERAAMAERAHHLLGSIRGLQTVHAYALEQQASDRIARGSWGVVRWSMRARIVQNRLFGRVNLAEFVGMATIVLVGFYLVQADAVTVGAVTTAMLLFLRLFGPIGALLLVMDDIQSAAASLARIVGVIDLAETGEQRPAAAADTAPGAPELSVERVGFRYAGHHRRVLDDVTVVIRPGETVAVVGTSGAGKSTLAALLAGVHTPESGTVRVGSTPVGDLPEGAAPVLLTQDVHVFAGTLIDDLRLVAPEAGEEQVRAALERVGAWDWVSRLDSGLDTVVGGAGHALTPMREQQLALARIVLLDPPAVILDEATADADSSEADVLEDAAQAALRGRTALVVAHRLSQAARADRILVMESGRIVEEGTHDALRSAGGRYSQLWAAWTRHR